uniref:Peptidase S1 domain-containing protein n=2 Tax=Clastoptera arizonana TaxID=38151 RepID=A0A1B6C4B5_9HEMI
MCHAIPHFVVMISLLFNLFFIGCSGFSIPESSTDRKTDSNIPYQVIISFGDAEPVCSGALITDSIILTSASCIYSGFNNENDFLENAVLFGGGKVLLYLLGNVSNVAVHPEYNRMDSSNDIALVKVWQSLPRKRISPISLSSFDSNNQTCTVSTWWDEKKNLWGNIENKEIFFEKCGLEDGIFCITSTNNTTVLEKKDTGSPIVCNGKLAGIATLNGHVTNLSYYFIWIKNTIRWMGPLNDTSEILDPLSVNVLDQLQSQKIISLLNELTQLIKNQNTTQDEISSYWNPRVVVPLNYVIFATIIFLFAIMLYHTLVNVALVYFSKR